MKLKINRIPNKDKTDYYIKIAYTQNINYKPKTINVFNVGKYSELSKEHNDVEKYIKEVLAEQQKIYDSNEYRNVISLNLRRDKHISKGDTKPFHVGYLFVKRIYDSLKLNELMNDIQKNYKIKYNLNDIALLLLGLRAINPDSKFGMLNFYNTNNIENNYYHKDVIYRAMDILYENKTKILTHLYNNKVEGIERNKEVLYYDCTNTYFETEIEEGLKHRGKGKRNETEPLVSFGLVLDGNGIPLTCVTFRGGQNEQKTLIPLEKTIIKDFKNSKFIMITDAGLSSKENRAFNSINNRKFVTTLPVRTMSEEKLENFIFDNKPWISNLPSNEENKEYIIFNTPELIINKYNEIMQKIIDNTFCNNDEITLKKLNEIILYKKHPVLMDKKSKEYRTQKDDIYIDENYIVSFSLKYFISQRRKRNDLIEKAKKLINKKIDKKNYNSSDPKSLIKIEQIVTNTGELANEKVFSLNNELIEKQKRLDGYYCVTTNLVEDDYETIIKIMKYRWFIEDSFRILKHFFDFRPVEHSKDQRIDTHFFTCFLTLLIYRYMQKILINNNIKISDEELISFIRNYRLSCIKKNYYVPAFELDDLTLKIEEAFNIHLSYEVMLASDVKKQIKNKLKGQ